MEVAPPTGLYAGYSQSDQRELLVGHAVVT